MELTEPGERVAETSLLTNLHEGGQAFVGRETSLSEIERHLYHATPPRRRVAIVGNGGVGKSTLATHFAHVHRDKYAIVWRVRAASPSTTAADLASLARRLGAQGAAAEDMRAASRWARRELQKRDDWLLILDNALSPEDAAAALPWGTTGHVLITSQNQSWKSLAMTVMLRPWTREESVEFLHNQVGGQMDDELANKLAIALGDLPLAMQQAAACMTRGGVKPDDYLREFESHWAELLRRGKPSTQYPLSCAMAWELSFRQIESIDPLATEVMNLCAFLAPDGVALSMIIDSAEDFAGELASLADDPSKLRQSLEVLSRFALIQGSEKSVNMHRVISLLTRDRLSVDERATWASHALATANKAFRFDSQDHSTWPACAEVLPHMLASATFGQVVELHPALLVDAMSRAGRYLLKQGQYSEAKYALDIAWNWVRQAFGDESSQAADIANNLGRVLHRLGDFSGAQRLYEIALQFDRRTYGEQDVRVATVANNYAMTLASLGQYSAARGHFELALQIYADRGLAPNARTAGVMNNLGFVLQRLNALDEAGQRLAEALAITQQVQGPGHPNVACILSNLGRLQLLRHDPKLAMDLFMHAMAIDQKALGNFHPAVARDLASAGETAQLLGNMASAEEMFARAVSIQESAYGRDHLILAKHLNDLGRCQKAAGKLEQAARSFERASLIAAGAHRAQNDDALLSADELVIDE